MKSTQVGHNMNQKNKKEDRRNLHVVNAKDFQDLVSFDSLNAGDSFKFPRIKGSPQGECPLHVKVRQAHDEDLAVVNYHILNENGDVVHRDWIPSVTMVIMVERRITKK